MTEAPGEILEKSAGRRAREWITMRTMLAMFCHARHGSPRGGLCPRCAALRDYAALRLTRCKFGEDKPTCARCPVHCYKPDHRSLMREIMRWAGPRMMWRHPVMALVHLLDGRRDPPVRPKPETPAG
ncbi:MAG: nitrous oxide-stimulated promoter family protein [Telmatospirillum sp.]|nr:nitrous oxide-stimulated promoter family protein [Telmatospirillum sp.]